MKNKVAILAIGSVLSESSFFTVKEIKKDCIVATDDHGTEVSIGNPYVEKVLVAADFFDKEEKKTMTELSELFIGSPRIAMSVCYIKKDVDKTKKAYNAEVQDAIDRVQNAKVSDVPGLLKDLIENPIAKSTPGGLRTMKGRHHGYVDNLGRVHFVDMEQPKSSGIADTRMRQVDPRTIQWVIIDGVKYSLK